MKIRNTSTVVGLLIILAIIPVFTHFRSQQLETPKPLVETVDTYPALDWARVVYLGYNAFTAQFIMAKTQYYYGQHYLTDRTYPLLTQMVKVTITLNPHLAGLLIPFGDAVLTSMGTKEAIEEANRLLAFGHTIDPDNYKFVFNQGYNYFFYLGDETIAYKLLYEGAQMKSAPKKLYWLVSRAIANSGGYQLGLYYTKERLKNAKDKHMKEELGKRETLFEHLIALSNIAERYAKENTAPLDKSLSLLVKSGYISTLPQDPYGGEYKYDVEKKRVYSTTAKDGFFATRKRLEKEEKEKKENRIKLQK